MSSSGMIMVVGMVGLMAVCVASCSSGAVAYNKNWGGLKDLIDGTETTDEYADETAVVDDPAAAPAADPAAAPAAAPAAPAAVSWKNPPKNCRWTRRYTEGPVDGGKKWYCMGEQWDTGVRDGTYGNAFDNQQCAARKECADFHFALMKQNGKVPYWDSPFQPTADQAPAPKNCKFKERVAGAGNVWKCPAGTWDTGITWGTWNNAEWDKQQCAESAECGTWHFNRVFHFGRSPSSTVKGKVSSPRS